MCVIMLVTKTRPTEYMIERAWLRNDDGGGVAWREKGEVKWKKGIDTAEEMSDLIKTLPTPFVAHFRIASSGGIRRELTHPFPIEKNTSLALTGKTKGQVLFHNGDWKGWEPDVKAAAIYSNTHLPIGRMNDSRAMAWLCSIYGVGFMDLLVTQRGVAFGPANYEIFTGNGWTEINGVWCSNDLFLPKVGTKYVVDGDSFCHFTACIRRDVDSKGYCPLHVNGVEQHNGNVSSKPESGGTQNPAIPFAPGTTLVSLVMWEQLHATKDDSGKRMVSKNLIKKVRALYWELNCNDLKRNAKAFTELETLSLSLTSCGPVN